MGLKFFFLGFNFVASGRKQFFSVPGIKKWVIIPYFINFSLFTSGLFLGAGEIKSLAQDSVRFLIDISGWRFLEWLQYPLLIVFWIVFIVVFFYFIYLIGSVLASPVYSVLAEKVLVHRGVISFTKVTSYEAVKNALSMFWVSLLRTVLLLLVGIGLFICSFIPGLNLLAGYFAFVLLAFDSSDYAMEALNFSLSDRLAYFRNHFTEFLGMGTFVGLTVFVPGLILVIMPFAVMGAAAQIRVALPARVQNDSRAHS